MLSIFVQMLACLVHLDTPHPSSSIPPKNAAQVDQLTLEHAERRHVELAAEAEDEAPRVSRITAEGLGFPG